MCADETDTHRQHPCVLKTRWVQAKPTHLSVKSGRARKFTAKEATEVSLGCRVHGSGFRVHRSGFRVKGAGFRVQGPGLRVSTRIEA